MTELKPFPHQVENRNWMVQQKRCILGDDMGLGKTNSVIMTLKALKHSKMLVVCPASLKRNWQAEFSLWYPEAPFTILEGTAKKREQILSEYMGRQGVLCCNYEQLKIKKDRTIPFELSAIAKMGFESLSVDEAHVLRNRKTLSYLGINHLAQHIPTLFLLTGTPIYNKVPDLWTLLHMIDRQRYSSYWRFVDHPVYGCGKEKNAFGGVTVGIRSKNPDALKQEIAPIFRRKLKEEVLPDLPEKTYQKIYVKLKPDEQKVYDEMLAEWIAQLKENREVAAPVIISQITRLKQFCISPDLAVMPLLNGEKFGHGWKTSKFEVLLELIQSTDQKIVVFTQFERAVTLGMAMCEENGIKAVRHTGKENTRLRDEALSAFRKENDVQVVWLTTQSGGVGLNLTEASICVFLDKVWSDAANEQAANRIHRPGQKKAVTIYELLVENSIETLRIEPLLNNKRELTEEIIKMADKRVREERR
jgi:SNF2 family DNA or RNA helicase